MEKLNEAIKIEITEEEDQETEMESITEYELIITNTKAITETTPLSGELKALIIAAEGLCNIEIRMKKYPEIKLLELVNYQGTQYLPLKVLSIVNSGDRANMSPSCYLLEEDVLEIIVEGTLNNAVKVEFRMED